MVPEQAQLLISHFADQWQGHVMLFRTKLDKMVLRVLPEPIDRDRQRQLLPYFLDLMPFQYIVCHCFHSVFLLPHVVVEIIFY